MVVSAILTTALAPITGALFGASYGTSIRIGYEIIFPALFGDIINEQKNNPSKLQEQGSKRTIQAMHKMFTGVGGAAAMEFGIEQGIEMAKKKTESPDVQNMIDSSLGLTNRQLNLRGKARQFQDPLKEKDEFEEVKEFKEKNLTGFLGESSASIIRFFESVGMFEIDKWHKIFLAEKHNGQIRLKVSQIIKRRKSEQKTVDEGIEEHTVKGSIVEQIATLFNKLKRPMLIATNRAGNALVRSQNKKIFLTLTKEYNRFVARNGKSQLQIDTAKSLAQRRLVPK